MNVHAFNLPRSMLRRWFIHEISPARPEETPQEATLSSEALGHSAPPPVEVASNVAAEQEEVVQSTIAPAVVEPAIERPPLSSWSARGLFVVGCCRSGTTILENCLNESSDVFLLGEANLYLHLDKHDFVLWYNLMHTQFRNACAKDSWLPPAPDGATGGYETMARLARYYRWIGEKIAFGPHGRHGERLFQDVFLDYHAAHFYDSTYLLITRSPNEVVLSSAKMFGNRDHRALIAAWLHTQLLQIDLYRNFPRVRWVFFEDLSVEVVHDFARGIQIDLSLPAAAISQEEKRSRLRSGEIPDSLQDCATILEETLEVHSVLRHLVREPGQCRGSKNTALNNVGRRIVGLLNSIGEQPTQNWRERSAPRQAA